MRYAVLALALAAVSSTAEARITDFLCTASDGRQWTISTDDESRSASVTYNGGTAEHRAVFTPDDVRISLGQTYYFIISRTTLRFKAGSDIQESNPASGTCRIGQRAARKF
jgi:hypothetical protein